MIKIVLNGQEKNFSSATNLKDIIGQCCKENRHVIAEVNGDIVKKPVWESTAIKNGDAVELVNMVGGG